MKEPSKVTEVRRFLGMANQLSKFTPNLADLTKPLWNLLSKQNQWTWGEPQRKVYAAVKKALTQNPVLAPFDPSFPTIVSAECLLLWTGSGPASGAGEQREASRCLHFKGHVAH